MLPDPNDHLSRTRKQQWPLRGITVAIAGTALTVFIGLIGYTYVMHTGDSGGAVVPLIKADTRPMKTTPDKPGGMEVPNQDKEIYARIGREGTPLQNTRVERLLPPPESPMARPRPPNAPLPLEPEIPAPPSVVPPPGAVEVVQPAPVPVPVPAPAPSVAPPVAVPPASVARAPAPPVVAPPVTSVTPPTETTAAAAAAIAPAAGARFRVQLAAVRTNEDASRAWDTLKRAHMDLLGPLSFNAVRADLGERGTFYRIQAGPLASEAAAKELCRRLTEKKVGCLVVRP